MPSPQRARRPRYKCRVMVCTGSRRGGPRDCPRVTTKGCPYGVTAQSDQRGKAHFPELHLAVIPLEHNRARPFFIGVECATRYPRHLGVVDDFGSVHDHRHAIGNQGYVKGLPLPRGLVRFDGRER